MEEWVKLTVETDLVLTEMLEERLKAEGIPVLVKKEAAGSIYGLTSGPLAEAKILVPSDRLHEAKNIIKERSTEEEQP